MTLEGSEVCLKVEPHLVSVIGGTNTAVVTQVDVMATNGVVHMIDAVLVPAALEDLLMSVPTSNIPTLISSNPQLSTLMSLLGKAKLIGTLSSGQWTVFAPTNDAFAKLPAAFVLFLGTAGNQKALVRLAPILIINN